MISDVPLGAFLSGGVDSSAVVAMMAQVSDQPVRTFTIGFEEQLFDERRFARMVADRYGTRHEEMVVKPDAISILESLVYHYGEPFADSSAIPTYYVSKIAREQVTVILSGDGGDESFLGYPRYLNCRRQDETAGSAAVTAPGAWLRKILSTVAHRRRAPFAEVAPTASRSRRYEQYIAYFSDEAKNQLYSGDMKRYLARSSLDRLEPWLAEGPTFASGAAWADIHTYLPDDLLVKVDVASMANSLEVRAPFLDHKLMEWALRIPEQHRFRGDETKSLLKEAMEPHLPGELLYRPKMGFGVPIDVWLRNEMKAFAYETLLSDRASKRNLFDRGEVRRLLDRHSAGENWSSRIWALLMLELWFQMWIDKSDPFDSSVVRTIIHGNGRWNKELAMTL
jgi:asparagine synthase (glutamine-hydrolysing)